jgi:antitoxin VapB
LEPIGKPGRLLDILARWKPLDDPFPDVDEDLLPLDDAAS